MRDLILISIDGFVGGPDDGIKRVFDTDQEATAWTVETVWNASLHIMGLAGVVGVRQAKCSRAWRASRRPRLGVQDSRPRGSQTPQGALLSGTP